jgi:thymidylate synthase (FAD)
MLIPGIAMSEVLSSQGSIELVDKWGSDAKIIEAARMSTGKGFLGWEPQTQWNCCKFQRTDDEESKQQVPCPHCGKMMNPISLHKGDKKLLKYLYVNKHHTPFERCGASFEIKAPIFVVREWHRHRTQSYNELSGRYTEMPHAFYVPSLERIMEGKQATSNKQGSQTGIMLHDAELIQAQIHTINAACRSQYEELRAQGLSNELARLILPLNQMTKFRASANLRNWMNFLKLRLDKSAQWEIRQYAIELNKVLSAEFPRSMALFNGDVAE